MTAPRHAVQGRPSPATVRNDEMRETIKQLQERWTPEITAQTLADVSPRSPFGVLPSGFQDFRGFGYYDCLPDYLKKFPPPKYPPPSKEVVENFLERAWFETLDSFRFSSCDFTHARFLRAGVRNCDFQDCLFPSADMRLCTFIDTRFERCRFRSANFRRAFVDFGKLGETVFADCSFEKCNFAETSFMAPRFRRVAFSDCRSFLRFKASSFEDVSFSGKFTGVWFNGGFDKIDEKEYGRPPPNPMKDVSFADADIAGIGYDFRHRCPLSRITPPKEGGFICVERFGLCLREIRDAAQSEPDDVKGELLRYCFVHDLSQEAHRYFISWLKRLHFRFVRSLEYDTQEQFLVSLDELEKENLPRTYSILSRILSAYRFDPESVPPIRPCPPRPATP